MLAVRRLPHLNGLRAFDAAARCGSFAAAAAELNVSAAAVSRMVRVLEERLGVALFERGANRLRLTPHGRTYHVGLSPILDALAQLTDQVTTQAGSRALTVGVGPTFAVRWLIPRLPSFQEAAPDIDVRITTGGAAAPFADDWTCGIKLGDGRWPGVVAERLFDADLIPVCAPRLAQRLRSPRQLKPQMLLRVAHAPEDWPLWLKAAGLAGIAGRGTHVRVLRPGAAGGERRCRRVARHPAVHRRRCGRGAAGGAVRTRCAQGQLLVPGLQGSAQPGAGLPGVPAMDQTGRAGADRLTPATAWSPAGRRWRSACRSCRAPGARCQRRWRRSRRC